MTKEQLNDIRNPQLTVEQIFDALSPEERTEFRKKIFLGDGYTYQCIELVWKSLSTIEKSALLDVIYRDIANIYKERSDLHG